MKSPDQIKRALEFCSHDDECFDCPYNGNKRCIEHLCADARELIQQLEAIKDDFDEYARQY